MRSAQCQDLRRKQHRTEHSQRTEIKIPNPPGNRTRATGLEGRDSTDYATAMDYLRSQYYKMIQYNHLFHEKICTEKKE